MQLPYEKIRYKLAPQKLTTFSCNANAFTEPHNYPINLFCPSVQPSVHRAPYLRNRISSHHNFWHTQVWNDDISRCLFHFFDIFIFWAVEGKKLSKMKNKNHMCHVSHAISQEQYSIWSWFLVHLCKMMISPGIFFHFFEIFIFLAVRWLKGQKIAQNEK